MTFFYGGVGVKKRPINLVNL